jgi:hypothetical protein
MFLAVLKIRVADPGPGAFCPLDPGCIFFRIRDELSCWLLRIAPEIKWSKKKVVFIFHSSFLCRIRDPEIKIK